MRKKINENIDCQFAGGNGTQEDPYLISNIKHLNNVGKHLGKYFKQIEDIDFKSDTTAFNTIGITKYPEVCFKNPFNGNYNGNGYKISLNGPLFWKIGQRGIVEDLIVESYFYSQEDSIGVLAYTNNGLIEDCSCNIEIEGKDVVGGLVGTNNGHIFKCFVDGNVNGNENIGGIAGINYGSIYNAFTSGIYEGNFCGGITGQNHGDIEQCFSKSELEGGEVVGGIAGLNNGYISEGRTTNGYSGSNYIGGAVGVNNKEGLLIDCEAEGTIYYGTSSLIQFFEGDSQQTTVGKLVAINHGLIKYSFCNVVVKDFNTSDKMVGNNKGGIIDSYIYEEDDQQVSGDNQASKYSEWDTDTVWSFNEGRPYLRWGKDKWKLKRNIMFKSELC